MPAPARELRVRMYRVGFGDCFLVTVGEGAERGHALVDCGVHPTADIKTFDKVMDDIERTTDGRLGFLVASHEHADHISGYGRYRDRFAAFRIGEVWMPWALDPNDPDAVALRTRRLELVRTLALHLEAVGGPPEIADVLLNLGFAPGSLGVSSNAVAVDALRSGFGGAARKVRYFQAGARPEVPEELRGLTARVLGPPRDAAFLKRMDPPAGQRYLQLKGRRAEAVNALVPFLKKWELLPAEGRRRLRTRAADELDLAGELEDSIHQLALSLDTAANNTSLVLLLDFVGHTLLFPGDAQWGNWQSWLEAPGAESLLAGLSFFKVAHHGSHNATPRRALEGMPTGEFAAMVSTQSKPWKSIPREPLMTRLTEKTRGRVVRSDSVKVAGAVAGPPLKARLPTGFKRGAQWLDYVYRLS